MIKPRTKQILAGQIIAFSALAFQVVSLINAYQYLGLARIRDNMLKTKILTVLSSEHSSNDIVLFGSVIFLIHITAGLVSVFIYRIMFHLKGPKDGIAAYVFFGFIFWYCIAGWAAISFPFSNQSRALDLIFIYNLQYRYFVFILTATIIVLLAASLVYIASQKISYITRLKPKVAAYAFLIISIGIASIYGFNRQNNYSNVKFESPDIYIIGIDSLSLDRLNTTNPALIYELNSFIDSSVVIEEASTPLARTFPAWVSMLSGNYPITNGVRINLQPREFINSDNLISSKLQSLGYTTVYSTDESRFSNIDESYGFNEIITSKQGSLDFLIGTFNDFWVTNFLVNTRLFGWLFPYNYTNRASYHHYLPTTYSDHLESRMSAIYRSSEKTGSPLFFAIHLCALHWPYITTPKLTKSRMLSGIEPDFDGYTYNMGAINNQLESILQSIDQSGRADNSWIFLISDHGEEIIPKIKDRSNSGQEIERINKITFGHGGNVLSNEQYGVLIAIKAPRNFGTKNRINTKRKASLVDLAPTIADIVGINMEAEGHSLLQMEEDPSGRVILRESGYKPRNLGSGTLAEARLLNRAADFYRLADDGRFEFKSELIPPLIEMKARAIEFGDYILALEYQWKTQEWLWLLNHNGDLSSFSVTGDQSESLNKLIKLFCDSWKDDNLYEPACAEHLLQ